MNRWTTLVVALATTSVCVWAQPLAAPTALSARYAQLSADATLDSDVRDSNLPLAALHLELADRLAQANYADHPLRARALRQAAEDLDRCAAGEIAGAGLTGAESREGYLERAYLCRTDGSPQPYFVRLPPDYDPARQYPLVVFLHGYTPNTSKLDPWLLMPSQWQLAADRGVILVLPHGRSNTDFLGIGEVDVLRVIEEMERFYSVDPDRIHLSGTSMGGYGAYAIALRYPDRFASVTPMSGQSDFFLWERRDRAAVAFKTWLISQNNPLDLAVNARHLPMLIQHGELDNLVPVRHSRLMAARLAELGYNATYHEYRGGGHYLYWEDPPLAEVFDFVFDKQRVVAPAQISFRTFTPRQGRAYWVDIRRLQAWGPAGEVEAEIANGALSLRTTNVAELYLDPPQQLRGAGPVRVSHNGNDLGELGAGWQRLTVADDGTATLDPGAPPALRPTVGPAREVFNAPFLVTYPADDPARQAEAARFAQLWGVFADATITPVPDVALTADQVSGHNLVVCGRPDEARLAGLDRATLLPAGLTSDVAGLHLGAATYPIAGAAPELGAVLLTRHPVRPEGLILWLAGARYGGGLPLNHQFDLWPDLLVYGRELADDGTNAFRVGGFLSPDLALDPAKLEVAAP